MGVLGAIGLIILVVFLPCLLIDNRGKPKVGEIWEEYQVNPFNEGKQKKVVEIKRNVDGRLWIKYYQIGTGLEFSESVSSFMNGHVRVDNKKK